MGFQFILQLDHFILNLLYNLPLLLKCLLEILCLLFIVIYELLVRTLKHFQQILVIRAKLSQSIDLILCFP